MRGFFLRKAGAALIVVFLASIIVFAGTRALPGDPALVLAGEDRSPHALAEIRVKYGLNDPLPVQYASWLTHALTGDFGVSRRAGLSVGGTIVDRIPITLELAFLSILVALALGIPAGVIAAVKRGSAADYASGTLALAGLSIPHFWLGLLLILVFAVRLRILPASGYVPFVEDPVENLRRMIMPALVLGTGVSAVVMRQMRSAMLESLSADYVRTARAKGLSERQVIIGHAMRNSLLTVVTVVGLSLGALISGAVITEQIFVIPGFGRLTIEAVNQRDYALIQGVVFVAAAGYVLINLLVDALYSYLNPRIRVSGRPG
ncbi:MAG: peptide/nickel transport system permease protein [Solirubrobacteraceae bacterium]